MKKAKTASNKIDAQHTTQPSNEQAYGEFYNKNVVYIYKDNSTTRVTYDAKNINYIERKQI